MSKYPPNANKDKYRPKRFALDAAPWMQECATVKDPEMMPDRLRYTRLCNSVMSNKVCRHGSNCRFAHTPNQLRKKPCPFGVGCHFVQRTLSEEWGNVPGYKICDKLHPGETDHNFNDRVIQSLMTPYEESESEWHTQTRRFRKHPPKDVLESPEHRIESLPGDQVSWASRAARPPVAETVSPSSLVDPPYSLSPSREDGFSRSPSPVPDESGGVTEVPDESARVTEVPGESARVTEVPMTEEIIIQIHNPRDATELHVCAICAQTLQTASTCGKVKVIRVNH